LEAESTPHRRRFVKRAVLAPATLAALGLALSASAAAAGDGVALGARSTVEGATFGGGACAGGDIHDDGVAENGYGWNPATVDDGRFVDPFDPTSYPFRYTSVCVCWTRLGEDADLAYEVVAYDDDGPGGGPGTLLGSVAAIATALPVGLPGRFETVDIQSMNLEIESGRVFLGVRWNPDTEREFYVCADESLGTPDRAGFAFEDFGPWTFTEFIFPSYRSLLVRAVGGPVVPSVLEVPSLGAAGFAALTALLASLSLARLRRRKS
jgi:hypothetical protein